MSVDRTRYGLIVLAIVAAGFAVQLGASMVRYGRDSLQMDFASFWIAGEAASRDLSPYLNHVDADPPLWDGISFYRHSRFLYPPLVADLFRPMAWLPYGSAKRIWMVVALAALIGALALAWRESGCCRGEASAVRWGRAALFAAAGAVLFFPTRALLERGQIDSVTLLLLVGTFVLRDRRPLAAGGLLALATLLKLHCGFVLPFLLLGRRWRLLGGAVAGGAALLLIGALSNGPSAARDYVENQLPRISRYGEGGARTDRLPAQAFRRAMAGVPQGKAAIDGQAYDREAIRFVLNASAVRTPLGRSVFNALKGTGMTVAPAHVSLVFLLVAFGVAALLRWRWGPPPSAIGAALLLVVVLLCAPVTWAMSTVWLPAALPAVASVWPSLRGDPVGRAGVGLVVTGVLLAALPDGLVAGTLGVELQSGLAHVYLVSESTTLIGLLLAWWRSTVVPG